MADKKAGATSKTSAAADAAAATPSATRGSCSVDKCKQPLRAKGFCRKHYFAWRRQAVGNHHRYKICTKEACRKPRQHGSLCAEHSSKGPAAEGATT